MAWREDPKTRLVRPLHLIFSLSPLFSLAFGLSLLVTLPSCGAPDTASSGPGAPQGLLCELLRWPEKALITDPNPEFSWIVNDSRRGAVQSAYRLLVASSEELLSAENGDLWDSGKVSSSQSTAVEYRGTAIEPGQTCWWTVRTWDQDGIPGPWAQARSFTRSPLDPAGRRWPGESRWVQLPNGRWFLEDRQRAQFQEIAPVQLVQLGPGHFFADFGKAAFGTLKLRTPAANVVEPAAVLLGERATPDGRVDTAPGRSNIGFSSIPLNLDSASRELIVGLPRHRSRFPHSQSLPDHLPEVTPFRYAEITGWPDEIEETDIRQLALLYPFDDEAASFRCSDEQLNQVWDLCKYTLKATPFLSLYADGNRERMPYEADAYIQQLGHYAVDREFSAARYTNRFLLSHSTWPTEWQMHAILSAWADFLATGDAEFLVENYEQLKTRTLIELSRDDGLISTRTGLVTRDLLDRLHFSGDRLEDIVDWPAGTPPGESQASNRGATPEGERDGFDFQAVNSVVNAFHYRSIRLMERIAAHLGKEEDQAFFSDRADTVYRSFQRAFFDPERKIYLDGEGSEHASLHANMFPLAFGLVPDQYRASAVEFAVGRGMACSVYGAQYLLEALFDNGAPQAALELMRSDGQRSWLNMMRVGSTMTTEAWDEYYKPNLTWNHAWGSAPANIIARKLMGIEPLEPGYRRVRIRPQPGDLEWADIRVPTISGPVVCSWERAGQNRFILDVLIPANSEGEIWAPTSALDQLLEGGRPVRQVPDISVSQPEGGWTVCRAGSGRYRFEGTLSRK